jgi:hypothetical protein
MVRRVDSLNDLWQHFNAPVGRHCEGQLKNAVMDPRIPGGRKLSHHLANLIRHLGSDLA